MIWPNSSKLTLKILKVSHILLYYYRCFIGFNFLERSGNKRKIVGGD
jgi:hypothetical protein